MSDEQSVIIVDASGTEHEFPSGFDPKKAAGIVRYRTQAHPPSAEDFMRPEDIANRDNTPGGSSVLRDIGRGLVKGVAGSVAGMGEMAANAGMIPGVQPAAFNPDMRHPAFTRAEQATTANNPGETLGKRAELAAELYAPARGIVMAAPGIARAAVRKFGDPVARGMMRETPLITQARQAVTKKIFGRMVDASKKVELPARTPEPPARVTTAPEPSLPPGYTPRTTAPKPKAAKMSGPSPKSAPEPAAPPRQRAYFLKSEADMAPAVEDAVAPLGRPVTVNDLPMAWRSRVDTPLLKPQGAAGAQLGADATAELSRRGLSATDALDAIAKNPRLTPNVRLQLREALLTALGQQ